MRRRVAPGADGRWPGEPPKGGDTSETRSAILSGILEREPGGTWSEHVLSHGEDDQLCV